MASRTKPVFVFAFANDYQSSKRYLRHLPEERRRIKKYFSEVEGLVGTRSEEAESRVQVVFLTDVTPKRLIDAFKQYGDRIALFHFGGHADWYELYLETERGAVQPAHAEGMADLLAVQQNLQLVFLNGCFTEPQAEMYRERGVPVVVGTSSAIKDRIAAEFADQFYMGLAGGKSIKVAYDEAVGAVKFEVGHLRDAYRSDAGQGASADWPWKRHVRAGAEEALDWNLPDAIGDPLFCLPKLPECDLPARPFRYLDRFEAEEAELFFGRGREIRDAYVRITSRSADPVLLLCGESGVGKSSLLAAGLLPRLRAGSYAVEYVRRGKAGLVGALAQGLGMTQSAVETSAEALSPEDVLAVWRQAEQRQGGSLTVILDQAEEAYTRQDEAEAKREVDAFIRVLTGIVEHRDRRPKGKLVLAFRKEWLADFRKRMYKAHIPNSEMILSRLDREGIVEAVEGLTRKDRLKEKYHLEVQEGVAQRIADKLLMDPKAPVAPTLQILLTKMWEDQVDQQPRRFTHELYAQFEREGLWLSDFLNEQITALQGAVKQAEESGLLLDVLAFHTTEQGTAERRTMEEVERRYVVGSDDARQRRFQRSRKDIDAVIDACEEHHLISKTGETTRLAHDTLAPLIRQRLDQSDRPGQRAQRILVNRVSGKSDKEQSQETKKSHSSDRVDLTTIKDGQSGVNGVSNKSNSDNNQESDKISPLDRVDLKIVEDGQPGMKAWDERESKLIQASRRRRAHGNALRLILLICFIVFLGVLLKQQFEITKAAYISTAYAIANRSHDQEGRDEYHGDKLRLLLARHAYLFNKKYKGELFGTIDRAVRLAIENGVASRLEDGYRVIMDGLKMSPDGEKLIFIDTEGSLIIRDLVSRRDSFVFRDVSSVNGITSSRGEAGLAIGGNNGSLRVLNIAKLDHGYTDFPDHLGPVNAVAYVSGDSTMKLVDEEGHVYSYQGSLRVLTDEPLSYEAIAMAPDGSKLVTWAPGSPLQLWDLGSTSFPIRPTFLLNSYLITDRDHPNLVHPQLWFSDPPYSINSLVFSQSGTVLAALRSDGAILIWNFRNYDPRDLEIEKWNQDISDFRDLETDWWKRSILKRRARLITLSSDGMWLAAVHESSGRIDLFDLNDVFDSVTEMRRPRPDPRPTYPRGEVQAVALNRDATRLAVSYTNSTVQVWELPGGDGLTLEFSQRRWFMPTSRDLPSSRDSPPLSFGSTHPGNVDRYGVTALAFNPEGRVLFTGVADSTLRLWNLDSTHTGRARVEPESLKMRASVSALAVSPSSAVLASVDSTGTVLLWDLRKEDVGPSRLEGNGQDRLISLSADGRMLAAVDESSGRIDLFDVADIQRPTLGPRLAYSRGKVRAVALNRDATWLAVSGTDRTVQVWELPGGNEFILELPQEASTVTALALGPEGRVLATGAPSGTLRLWDLDSESPTLDPLLLSHYRTSPVTHAVFDDSGDRIAVSHADDITLVHTLDLAFMSNIICRKLDRNMDDQEWHNMVGNIKYEETCDFSNLQNRISFTASHNESGVE